jgi:hypothetical protein
MARLSRTIEVISYRGEKENLQYVYSLTKEYWDNSIQLIRKFITREEVETHLKTGNWVKYTADRDGSSIASKMIIQVVEYYPLHIPVERRKDNTIVNGEDEFTEIRKRD